MNLVPGAAPQQPFGGIRTRAVRCRQRLFRTSGRHYPSLPLRSCRILPEHGSATGFGTQHRTAMFPDSESILTSHRYRIQQGNHSDRYSECHAMDLGNRYYPPHHLFPDDVQQHHPQNRSQRHRLRNRQIPVTPPRRDQTTARCPDRDRITDVDFSIIYDPLSLLFSRFGIPEREFFKISSLSKTKMSGSSACGSSLLRVRAHVWSTGSEVSTTKC